MFVTYNPPDEGMDASALSLIEALTSAEVEALDTIYDISSPEQLAVSSALPLA
jgi:hypothetical protein